MGIRDIKDFNVALLAKQSWRIVQNPHSLFAKVYKANVVSKSTMLEAKKGIDLALLRETSIKVICSYPKVSNGLSEMETK